MRNIFVRYWDDVPPNYTGKATIARIRAIGYFKNGQLHRPNGLAAIISYSKSGEAEAWMYFEHGEGISPGVIERRRAEKRILLSGKRFKKVSNKK